MPIDHKPLKPCPLGEEAYYMTMDANGPCAHWITGMNSPWVLVRHHVKGISGAISYTETVDEFVDRWNNRTKPSLGIDKDYVLTNDLVLCKGTTLGAVVEKIRKLFPEKM